MSQDRKSWATLAMVSVAALGMGYTLPRAERREGDLLEAVAVLQRRSPQFLISEPRPGANWANAGALYLCRTPKTAEDVESLSKHPWCADPGWNGVVCFRGKADNPQHYIPWVSDGGDRCLDYGSFAVFGDSNMLQEVRAILSSEGLHPLN